MSQSAAPAQAALRSMPGGLTLSGPLTASGIGRLWNNAIAAAKQSRGQTLAIDMSGATSFDMSGAALILAMERAFGGTASLRGADSQALELVEQVRAAAPKTEPPAKAQSGGGPGFLAGWKISITFFGAAILATMALPANLRVLRGSDFFRITDNAGLRALPLVLMLGFLIGLILAFQSAIPMRQFGAEIFVANLVSIALFRELGPLLVAVILSGRTGSAFAAELGTMQVNEEIAALTTMGIAPETMLVLPRVAATMLVMPGLTTAMNLAGLLGMGVVLYLMGYPPTVIAHQVNSTSHPSDFIMGLGKGIVFAGTIALIGCRAGLNASRGAQAVGEAATQAVVGGIVASVVLDGIFAIIFFQLGW
jgi:phospholipid/cholesterol/gamma-HCH transport system permease protein